MSDLGGADRDADVYAERPSSTRPGSTAPGSAAPAAARTASRHRPRMHRVGHRRAAKPRKQPLPIWQETVLLIGTALILALLIKTFLVQAFYIPSGSMRETLRVNDRILVEKWSYWFDDIDRGDIVVFDDPANWLGEEEVQASSNGVSSLLSKVGLYPTGGHLVKRVIGVAGDEVACVDGKVEVNGTALREGDYVTLADQACTGDFDVVVPDDRIWVLGDNREHSADSRAHTGDPGGGFIPTEDVVGKVFVVVWPIKHWGFVHTPGTFDNPALDQAAGLVSTTAPVGLALVGFGPLYRRLRLSPSGQGSTRERPRNRPRTEETRPSA